MSFAAVALICVIAAPAAARADDWGPFRNPFDVGADWIRKQGVPLPLPPGHPSHRQSVERGSTSEIQVVRPPFIDENGNIWSGSGSGGGSGSVVGRATLTHDRLGQAWWEAPGGGAWANLPAKRAPSHLDRPAMPPPPPAYQPPPPAYQPPPRSAYQLDPAASPPRQFVRFVSSVPGLVSSSARVVGYPQWREFSLVQGQSTELNVQGPIEVTFPHRLGVASGTVPANSVLEFQFDGVRLVLKRVR